VDAVRVFIADADPSSRADLAEIVRVTSGLDLVGATAPDEDGLLEVLGTAPDAVALRVPTTDRAVDLCRRMLDARPGLRCLVICGDDDEAFIQAVLIGASEIVRRDRLAAALTGARSDLRDEARRLLHEHGAEKTEAVFSSLPEQQRNVALLVVAGATNSEIAGRLSLSPHTVRNYLSRIMARVGSRNRTHLAVSLAAAMLSSERTGGPPEAS
jgi:DNA-binding NarL/FixJ family response regulator